MISQKRVDLKKLPLKRRLEEVAAHVWLGGRVEGGELEFDNVWSLHELASKTYFEDIDLILEAINKTLSCANCKVACRRLIANREHMPVDMFKTEPCCLYSWKVEMRSDHASISNDWPAFNRTVAVVKPYSDPMTIDAVKEQLGEEALIARKEVRLSQQDVAFLYTSAYGKDYVQQLMDYMTSGVSTILLLEKNNIGNMQNAIKEKVRARTQQASHLKNNIHLPDSLHESFAQVAYFFGTEYGSNMNG